MYELPWFNDRRRSPAPVEVLAPPAFETVDLPDIPAPTSDHLNHWQSLDSSPGQNRKKVHTYFRAQKPDIEWGEANRLAHRRASHESRTWGHQDLGAYAESYKGHLQNVVAEMISGSHSR